MSQKIRHSLGPSIIIAIAVLIIRRTRKDEFRRGRWYDVLLYVSVTVITCGAVYSLWGLIPKK